MGYVSDFNILFNKFGFYRKPVKVIFTLEHGVGNVIARQSVDVRMCSCPKRDKQQDEKRISDQNKTAKEVADNFVRANSSLCYVQPPPDKKRRLGHVENMKLLPVSEQDWNSLNKIAEALMFQRHPDKLQEIKNLRKRLHKQ